MQGNLISLWYQKTRWKLTEVILHGPSPEEGKYYISIHADWDKTFDGYEKSMRGIAFFKQVGKYVNLINIELVTLGFLTRSKV